MGWTDKVFGSSKNKKLDLQTKQQKGLTNEYLNALKGGAATNVDTLQDYAEEGYNPYDAIGGTALVDQMQKNIDADRQGQINALKGGHMNRFSMASAAATGNAYDQAQKQQTDLAYKDLLTQAQYGQQAYSNQNQAIGSLFNQSNSLLGLNTFQNQTQVNKGLTDYIGQSAGAVSDLVNMKKTLWG